MDLYHSIVVVGSCLWLFAMYRGLCWFINHRYRTTKPETYGERRVRIHDRTRDEIQREQR